MLGGKRSHSEHSTKTSLLGLLIFNCYSYVNALYSIELGKMTTCELQYKKGIAWNLLKQQI